MSTKIGPPGWQPHAIVSRLDGISVDGRMPDFIASMMAAPEARGEIVLSQLSVPAWHAVSACYAA